MGTTFHNDRSSQTTRKQKVEANEKKKALTEKLEQRVQQKRMARGQEKVYGQKLFIFDEYKRR